MQVFQHLVLRFELLRDMVGIEMSDVCVQVGSHFHSCTPDLAQVITVNSKGLKLRVVGNAFNALRCFEQVDYALDKYLFARDDHKEISIFYCLRPIARLNEGRNDNVILPESRLHARTIDLKRAVSAVLSIARSAI